MFEAIGRAQNNMKRQGTHFHTDILKRCTVDPSCSWMMVALITCSPTFEHWIFGHVLFDKKHGKASTVNYSKKHTESVKICSMKNLAFDGMKGVSEELFHFFF